MLCKVTHCAGRVSANTRPHQLCWGDREMGTAIISCVECSQVAGLIQKVGRDFSKSTVSSCSCPSCSCMHTICLMLSTWKVVDRTKWRSMVEIMPGVSLQQHHAVFHLLSFSSLLSKVNCSRLTSKSSPVTVILSSFM